MNNTRLKKSSKPYDWNGRTVYIFHDRENGEVVVSDSPAFEETYLVPYDELKAVVKSNSGIRRVPKPLTADKKAVKDDLNDFYDKMAYRIPFNCMNCGKPLYVASKFFKRCVTAHILPKAEFESVATCPDNILFLGWAVLGVCSCHDDWDRKGAENRSKMPIYKTAIVLFNNKIKQHLTDHELIKAFDYLNIK